MKENYYEVIKIIWKKIFWGNEVIFKVSDVKVIKIIWKKYSGGFDDIYMSHQNWPVQSYVKFFLGKCTHGLAAMSWDLAYVKMSKRCVTCVTKMFIGDFKMAKMFVNFWQCLCQFWCLLDPQVEKHTIVL